MRLLTDPQLVVDGLAHRRGDDSTGAVEHAQQVLTGANFLAVGGQHLPDAAAHRGVDIGGRMRREQFGLGGKLLLQVAQPAFMLIQLALAVHDLLAHLVETLRRAWQIVVAVADEQTLLCGVELDLVALEANAPRLDAEL